MRHAVHEPCSAIRWKLEGWLYVTVNAFRHRHTLRPLCAFVTVETLYEFSFSGAGAEVNHSA